MRSAYLRCLGQEEDWQRRARLLLTEVRGRSPRDRASTAAWCFRAAGARELEKSLLVRAATGPVAADLRWQLASTDIFKRRTVGTSGTPTSAKAGRLMWLYLRYWELIIELKKFKQVEKAILEK